MEPISKLADEFDQNLTLDPAELQETEAKHQQEDHYDDDEDDNDDDDDESVDEFEFFVGGGDLNSPVSAEEVFQNGQIRPIFPFFDDNASEEATTSSSGPPVKKLFVVSDDVAEGPYCSWSSEKSSEKAPATAPEMSQKSNSTGFSKLWRVRDLLVRSHSDGKDAFVFLTGKGEEQQQKVGTTSLEVEKKKKRLVNVPKIKTGSGSESGTVSYKEKKGKQKQQKKQSAYEALYGKKEKKAGKSYLPYRQDLVGFFTNSNGGMSRNVHPY